MMRRTAYEVLRLIDQAKDAGDLELANYLWAASFFARRFIGFHIEVETNDKKGESWYEAYYDLVWLKMGSKGANIPTPLLSAQAVAVAYKTATAFLPRLVHEREVRGVSDEEAAKMYSKAAALLKRISKKGDYREGLGFAVAAVLQDPSTASAVEGMLNLM